MDLSAQITDFQGRVGRCEALLGLPTVQADGVDCRHLDAVPGEALLDLADEVTAGSAALYAHVEKRQVKLLRLVEFVALRITEQSSNRILVQTGLRFPDSHELHACCLPGAHRRVCDSSKQTANRLLKALNRMHECSIELDYSGASFHLEADAAEGELGRKLRLCHHAEVKADAALPSVQTAVRLEIIPGRIVKRGDEAALRRVGLTRKSTTQWRAQAPHAVRLMSWLTEEEATQAQVLLHGSSAEEASAPLVGLNPHPVTFVDNERGTLCQQVAALNRQVDAVFHKDKRLVELERQVQAVKHWLCVEEASTARVLQQTAAKQEYVAHHANEMEEFVKVLSKVQGSAKYINPPALQDMPKYCERLERLEARSAVAASSASILHERVATLASDYYEAIAEMNAQMVQWHTQLASRAQ